MERENLEEMQIQRGNKTEFEIHNGDVNLMALKKRFNLTEKHRLYLNGVL